MVEMRESNRDYWENALEKNRGLKNEYQKRLASSILIHIAYESITDESHERSPHMRQRIAGIVQKECPECTVIHLGEHTAEALRHCRNRPPHSAIISPTLTEKYGITVTEFIRGVLGVGAHVIVLYKEDRCTLPQQLLDLPMIHYIHISDLKEKLPPLLVRS